MRWALFVLLFVFSVTEVIWFLVFIIRKEKVAAQHTAISFLLIWVIYICAEASYLFMPSIAFTLMIISFLVKSIFGYYLNLYHKSKKFDRLAHALGSFAFAIFFYYLLSNFLFYGGSRAFQALYILLLGVSVGTIYEIIEFFMDLNQRKKHKEKLQHGLKDTNIDLIADVIGSLAAAAMAFFVLL
ncbi:MAG: DUF2238 domain-containing protein [Clostridiales bacterium]|nr:DUF2238 domain-containing protein [Clostridiales bacterium]